MTIAATTQPLIVSFVGSSGVGKTTVLEQLIPLVGASGLRVGTVKHAPHGHQVDKVGSDSWRHRQAGAEAVLLAGIQGAVLFLAPTSESGAITPGAHHAPVESDDLDRIAAVVREHLHNVDVVLAEGFAAFDDSRTKNLVIEVRRQAVPAKFDSVERAKRARVWLTITDAPTERADEYGFDELTTVASKIIAARVPTTTS